MLDPDIRAALKQHIRWALGGFPIPEEYHGGLKNDPLYVPGEPIGLVEFLPSIKGIDPVSHVLLGQIVDAVITGVDKALEEQSANVAVRRPMDQPSLSLPHVAEALERCRALVAELKREGAHYRAATVAMAINIIAGDDQRKH